MSALDTASSLGTASFLESASSLDISDWGGIGSPFFAGVHSVGLANYRALLTEPGLPQQDLAHYPLKLAAALLMTLPVPLVFFVFQKCIIRTNAGALKE